MSLFHPFIALVANTEIVSEASTVISWKNYMYLYKIASTINNATYKPVFFEMLHHPYNTPTFKTKALYLVSNVERV